MAWATVGANSGHRAGDEKIMGLDHSRPLFTKVAESTVILWPMDQLGCWTTTATVTFRNASASHVRKAPPDAVSRIRRRPGAGSFSGRGVGILIAADQNSSAGNGCGARGSAQGWPGWGSSKYRSHTNKSRPEQ